MLIDTCNYVVEWKMEPKTNWGGLEYDASTNMASQPNHGFKKETPIESEIFMLPRKKNGSLRQLCDCFSG
jgi:hypothetical protein